MAISVLLADACSKTTNVTLEAPPTTVRATAPNSTLAPVPGDPTPEDYARCRVTVQDQLDALTDVDHAAGIYPNYARTVCEVAGPDVAPVCVAHAIDSAAEFARDSAHLPSGATIPESVQRGSLLSTCVISSIDARGGPRG